ncbi:hypothetical protein AB0B50_39510 [Streptomyces sp. NPDC041068]|uniref:ATP-binding protein n=1 Tax=Streptomyces sp. NPDC041068 TaxID=3155130 RepID=UPI0033ED3AA6
MQESGQARRAGNLPTETTSFVGRGAELRAVAAAVADARLVTLTGVGGVGKTRLAQRAGAELRGGFPDGVWLVGLSQLSEPALMALVLYEALRLADQTNRPAIEVVADWLADKELLLILDCCEHLAADCADFVRTLLAAAPGVRVLATSRRPLGLAGEDVVPVPPLPVDCQGTRLPDAVQLFMDRADEAAPSAVLAEEDGEAVAEICARLDGIPLAIELATARLQEMDLGLLQQRLHARFETLTAPHTWHDKGEPRHQALRTTIGWSHQLCTPEERLAWARLSVFAGGFEQEAAELVCAGGPLGSDRIGGLLSTLVDKSLLRSTTTPRGPRYSMLDTVREYGEEWLRELGEEQRLSERHRDYYRWLARLGYQEWSGPRQLDWYRRTTAEHGNLRTALDACLTDPDPRLALEMAGNLWFFWCCCGFQREGRHYLDQALARKPDTGPGPEWFCALWAGNLLASMQGDFDAAAAFEAVSTPMAERIGDPATIAAARCGTGARLALSGQVEQALAPFAEALGPPDRAAYAVRFLAMGGVAFSHFHKGEFARAAVAADALREQCEQRGELWSRGYALYCLSLAALGNRDPATAVRHARKALAIKWLLHDALGAAMILDAMAPAVAEHDPEQAALLLGVADTLWRFTGRAQFGAPELVAARRACERRIHDAIGGAAYEAAYRKGLESSSDDGITYALEEGPRATPEGGTPT